MKKYIPQAIVSIIVMLTWTNCERMGDFGDTNQDPSTSSYPETSALLTNVLAGLEKYSVPSLDPGFLSQPAALFCQYLNDTYLAGKSIYHQVKISPMEFYSGDLKDLQNIIDLNEDESTRARAAFSGPNENQVAIARILKAYIFWILTDCWGDIPYSEALNDITDVRFDTQEYIYKDLLQELTEAIEQFSSEEPVKGDIAYHGDATKWKRFANSLRLLISLRLSKQYPSTEDYAAVQFRSALEDEAGSIEDNEDNFQLVYPGGSFRNPFFNLYFIGDAVMGESATMTTLLGSLDNDPRQNVFGADKNGDPSTLGVPVGIKDPGAWCLENPNYCNIFHPENREETDPLYIVTASHVLLARAEAADRGWTSETSATNDLYQAGITQSFLQWGLDPPDDSYYNHPNVALSYSPGTGANLEQIATQVYIALYPSGVLAWSNWRRTGYPALLPAPDAINIPPTIPRRYTYGTEDYDLNPDGVAEAVSRLPGGDEMESRIWWDKE